MLKVDRRSNPEKRNINMLRLIKCTIRLIEIIPCFLVLSTVFEVNQELADGVVSGKYFWFYPSVVLPVALFYLIQDRLPQGAQGRRKDR